jgi:hypothetical protein
MAGFDRNITIDPAAAASTVGHPAIAEVIDLISGDIRRTIELIGNHRYDVFIKKRVDILDRMKSNQPLFACALRSTSVYVVSSPKKHFFFRHKVEDGSCPAQTRSALTEAQIRARKYHGLRESEAHKRIKRLIERSLAADSLFQADSILQERRWRSQHDPAQWRQPDICGRWALLESQDWTGKWKAKCKCNEFRPRINARDPTYAPDQEWYAALAFLFPEIERCVGTFFPPQSAGRRRVDGPPRPGR